MPSATMQVMGLDSIQRLQAFLTPTIFQKAQKAGLAYAAKAVPPAVAKGISASYTLSSARIKKDISGVRFAGDGTEAFIAFSRRPPTLTQFKPNLGKRGKQPGLGRGLGWGPSKPKSKPITAAIIKGQRKPFPGAFALAGLQGNQLIVRPNRYGTLSSIYGPSVGSIFLGQSTIGDQLRASVQARIIEQYDKGFERAMAAAARGFGGR